MPAAPRETMIPGLAACQLCGFEARGAIRRFVRSNRSGLFCEPCGTSVHGHAPGMARHVAVWAPETSQAALASLVRTAHVILHLNGSSADALPPAPSEFDELDFGDFIPELGDPPPDPDAKVPTGRPSRLVVGAHRVLAAATTGRSMALALLAARNDHRAQGRPRTGAPGVDARLAPGIRFLPDAVGSDEIEGWIEGGGTYAGWTAETLAAQLG